MQLGEGIKMALVALSNEADPTCSKEDKDPEWQSRVNDHGSLEKCTGQRLYVNMNKVAKPHEEKGLGVVPAKSEGATWNLANVDERKFPVQAHHLIPKNFLPDHVVCTWLAIKYNKHPKYKLRYDSKYDCDHANNGYCMPYATVLEEWGGDISNKTSIALKVMDQVGVQLHQGSHATVLDAAALALLAGREIVPTVIDVPGGADTDEMEEARIHEPGYLNRVKLLLNVVNGKCLRHASTCSVCRAKSEGDKIEVLPTEGVVRLMNQVSAIIVRLLKANVMHVSGYAYYHAVMRAKIEIVDNKIIVKGSAGEFALQIQSALRS